MKLEKIEGHDNYVCTVVKLPPKQVVPGLDKLVKVTVFGNDVLTGKDSSEDELYLFFPAESQLAEKYLMMNNEFRHTEKNIDRSKTGFFEDSGRVKAIKFKGVISTGYIAPVGSLIGVVQGWENLKVGDEFNTINGIELCKKYKVVRTQGTASAESRFNKKLRRFDKLVPNQFRFHQSTPPLAKCLAQFNPEDIVIITDKWHGTSAVFSNVLIKKQLSLLEKIAKLLGVEVVSTKYDNLYSSRSVLKNQYINTGEQQHYYSEDIWGTVNKVLKDKIEQGITIYGEIVGYLSSGKMIQKGYDYGCIGLTQGVERMDLGVDPPQHKFVVYRITYTKPDGTVIEFTWQQVKAYCAKYQLETVKELYHGKIGEKYKTDLSSYGDDLLWYLTQMYLEKDCPHCLNKVPTEGIVVRIDGRDTYSAFKLKSKRFLERETKQLDEEAKNNEVNIEEEA